MGAAGVGAGLGLLGSGVEAYGEYKRGQDELAAAEMNAASSMENARLTRIEAAEQARRTKIQGQKVVGDIRAGYGASGVQSTSGSALDVLQESAANAELDVLWTNYVGEMSARNFEREADRYRFSGRSAASQAKLGAVAKLLGGVAGAAAAGSRGAK